MLKKKQLDNNIVMFFSSIYNTPLFKQFVHINFILRAVSKVKLLRWASNKVLSCARPAYHPQAGIAMLVSCYI